MSLRRRFTILIAIIQLPLLVVVLFGDFGFYFPGAMGDFSDWATWVTGYLTALCVGCVSALSAKQYRIAVVQVAVPVAVTLIWLAYSTIETPREEEPAIIGTGADSRR